MPAGPPPQGRVSRQAARGMWAACGGRGTCSSTVAGAATRHGQRPQPAGLQAGTQAAEPRCSLLLQLPRCHPPGSQSTAPARSAAPGWSCRSPSPPAAPACSARAAPQRAPPSCTAGAGRVQHLQAGGGASGRLAGGLDGWRAGDPLPPPDSALLPAPGQRWGGRGALLQQARGLPAAAPPFWCRIN